MNAKALRLGVLITVAVQVPFLFFEWMALGQRFIRVRLLRLSWLGPLIAFYPVLRAPSSRVRKHTDGIIWIIYVASAAFIGYVAFLHDGYQSP